MSDDRNMYNMNRKLTR